MDKIFLMSTLLGVALCLSAVAMAQNRIEFKVTKLGSGLVV